MQKILEMTILNKYEESTIPTIYKIQQHKLDLFHQAYQRIGERYKSSQTTYQLWSQMERDVLRWKKLNKVDKTKYN